MKQASGEVLQEFAILSNTAGDPFTITFKGTEKVRNSGTMSFWSIPSAPLRDLLDFIRGEWIDVSQVGGKIKLDFEELYTLNIKSGLCFRARAHNLFGIGPLQVR